MILDLDDTLIATFDQIIKFQEALAAQALVPLLGRSSGSWEVQTLTARLLDLRRRDPSGIDSWLMSLKPKAGEELLALRRRAMSRAPLKALRLAVGTRSLLTRLSRSYRLMLLTEGCPLFQRRKIDRVRLAAFFDHIEVVDGLEKRKEDALRRFVSSDRSAGSAVVVGNRLDREIAAGAQLGLSTIWLRRGEGARRAFRPGDPKPTFVIRDIAQLPATLRRLPVRHC